MVTRDPTRARKPRHRSGHSPFIAPYISHSPRVPRCVSLDFANRIRMAASLLASRHPGGSIESPSRWRRIRHPASKLRKAPVSSSHAPTRIGPDVYHLTTS